MRRVTTLAAIAILAALALPGLPVLATDDASTESAASEEQATAAPETTDAVSTEIYLNGSSGNDGNDGLTYDTAVKTFARAKELAASLDSQTDETITIYITGTVNISGDISLDGIDAIVKRYASFTGNLMNVNTGATATLSSITIDGNSYGVTETVSASLISSYGTLNITDGTVLQNNAITSTAYFKSLGGAIRVYGGTLNMTGGEIKNNTANFGGGVFVGAGVMNMSGGTISGNSAIDMYSTRYSMRFPASGGGICVYDNSAVVNISGSAEIINNTSEDMGGGISVGIFLPSNSAETLNMTGGIVSGNTAGSSGGGIYVQGGRYEAAIGTANISGGTISNNTMDGTGEGNDSFGGGGIYVNGSSNYYNGVLNLTNALITENTATLQGGGYAACPISVTNINVNDGAAIYSNTASSANEIYILASNDYGLHSGSPTYSISSTMLGGTSYEWEYPDGTEVPLDELEGTLDPDAEESLSLSTGVTSDAAAESLAKVVITGNTSATRGGGIGSNGTVNIGTATDTVDVDVDKVWEGDESPDRPDSIEVELWRSVEGSDDEAVYVGYQTMEPDESGDWPTITFSDLPATDSDGNAYVYTVRERAVDGYSSDVTGNQEDGFVVTNSKVTSSETTSETTSGTTSDTTGSGSSSGRKVLPSTGDPSAGSNVLALLAVGAATIGVAWVVRRRSRQP